MLLLASPPVGAQPAAARRPASVPYQAPDPRTLLGPAPADLAPVIERYTSDWHSLRRFYDLPFSPATERVTRQFYEAWLAEIGQIHVERLPLEGRIDYILFKNKLEHEIRQLELNRKRWAEMIELLPFGGAIIELKEARQRVDPMEPAKAAAAVANLGRQVDELSARLTDPTKTTFQVRKTVAYRAARTVDRLRDVLKSSRPGVAAGSDQPRNGSGETRPMQRKTHDPI